MSNQDQQIRDWPALNVIKFVCLVVLIFVHAHLALITDSGAALDPFGFYYKITGNLMFLGLFLVALPIIAGVVLRMDLGGRLINEKIAPDDFKKILQAAAWLALVGFFMNALTWGFSYTFSWNVLQFVGLSFLIIAFLLKEFSIRTVGWLGLFALLAIGPLREIWGHWDYIYLVGIFIGAKNGFVLWPLFPWFGAVAFGFLAAHYYLKYQDTVKFRFGLLVLGAALLLIAVWRDEILPELDPNYVLATSLFNPKIGWVLAALGFFCLLIVVSNIFFNRVHFRRYGIINSYSKGILWIYVAQMFVSQKLGPVLREAFPLDKPTFAYFILPIGLIFLGWLVGTLCIKFLQEKSIVVTLKKIS